MKKLNLKAAIAQSGKTQTEIAKFMGVTNITMSSWVKDYKNINLSKLIKICEYIGFDIRELDLEGTAANDNE